MRLREFVVILEIVYDEQDINTTTIKYAIPATQPEIALAEAGYRLARKLPGAKIADAAVEQPSPRGNVIRHIRLREPMQ